MDSVACPMAHGMGGCTGTMTEQRQFGLVSAVTWAS